MSALMAYVTIFNGHCDLCLGDVTCCVSDGCARNRTTGLTELKGPQETLIWRQGQQACQT